jgi:hypothetical protein
MNFIAYIAIGLFAFVAAASAEPMKLTVNQLYSASVGIGQINAGYDEPATKDGKPTVLHRSFVFAPAVRIAMAVTSAKITDAIAPALKATKAASEAANATAKDGKIDPEAQKALAAENEKIGAETIEIDLTPISEADLALDRNTEITAATIQALLPIFKH